MTELEQLKEYFETLEYKQTMCFNDEQKQKLLEENDYDFNKVSEIFNETFPLIHLGSVITSDRRYERYYSTLYKHKVSGKYYVDLDCRSYGGDDEFREYCENLIEINESEADIFQNWMRLPFLN
jgi:hypothetical protein